jgi:hypothetical protein
MTGITGRKQETDRDQSEYKWCKEAGNWEWWTGEDKQEIDKSGEEKVTKACLLARRADIIMQAVSQVPHFLKGAPSRSIIEC